jgi:diguanylate cyclase (GGDEF)-like protein
MISWLIKQVGKFITVVSLTIAVSFTSFAITYVLELIFHLGMTTASYYVSFFLPLFMIPPMLYLEINSISKLEAARQQLTKMAQIDTLTDVPNRGYFFQLAEDALINAPPAHPIGLAIIDIDRFKLINDHYGHLAGDKALRAIAQTIQVHLRPGDIFGRFAGDEFILLCPNTTKSEIMELTRYLLQHVQTLSVGEKETETRLSATLGVTTAIPAMSSLTNLIASADSALLAAKQEGGGRVRYE